MQRLVVGLLLLALLGAGATVWLVNSYINKRTQATAAKPETSQTFRVVLVAKQNIPIGKKIVPADLDWLPWPEKGIQPHFLAGIRPDAKQAGKVIGAVARRGILKGTPMTEDAVFRSATPGFLAGVITPKMRAISVTVTPESGASGFIMPGDRVDVILMQDVERNLPKKPSLAEDSMKPYVRYVAETVLQNLRVLAVDQKVDDFEKKAQVSRTVTVEVTPKQAEAITVAAAPVP